jgi:hypothetical protein
MRWTRPRRVRWVVTTENCVVGFTREMASAQSGEKALVQVISDVTTTT